MPDLRRLTLGTPHRKIPAPARGTRGRLEWSWWVHHKLLANTGQQSGSDWVAIPDDLTDGGASFRTWFVPQSGQSPKQPTVP